MYYSNNLKKIIHQSHQKRIGKVLMISIIIISLIMMLEPIRWIWDQVQINDQISMSKQNMKNISNMSELYSYDDVYYRNRENPKWSVSSTDSVPFIYVSDPRSDMVVSPGSTKTKYSYLTNKEKDDYIITDPSTYTSRALSGLPKHNSPMNGHLEESTSTCNNTNCQHVGYSRSMGVFGY